MQTQNYKNHVRYYFPHHIIFYASAGILLITSLICLFKTSENFTLWLVLCGVIMLLIFLSLMLRQHYALGNQNRIVRIELRFRYYLLTQQRLEEVEAKLSESQLLALRFASDAELPALVTRAIQENLSSDQIKQSIKSWLPDYMRV